MSSELVFKTTSDLEAQKQELLSQLTSVKMELSKRSKMAEAVKRLTIANSDITQGKEKLREIYEMHETAMAEHDRATRHLSWCAEELDLARANVRSSIRRKRRANKSLKRLRNSYPPLPSSPPCFSTSLPFDGFASQSRWNLPKIFEYIVRARLHAHVLMEVCASCD